MYTYFKLVYFRQSLKEALLMARGGENVFIRSHE
jgi:hypothetical protein